MNFAPYTRIKRPDGYVYLWVPKSDPLFPGDRRRKAPCARMYEHRYVMARKLGRPLKRSEYVHHINGNRGDNRVCNLELWGRSQPPGRRRIDQMTTWVEEMTSAEVRRWLGKTSHASLVGRSGVKSGKTPT